MVVPTDRRRLPRMSATRPERQRSQTSTLVNQGKGKPAPVACVSCNGETFLPGVVATDLDTEHGGTDANKRDVARQVGRLNAADLQI